MSNHEFRRHQLYVKVVATRKAMRTAVRQALAHVKLEDVKTRFTLSDVLQVTRPGVNLRDFKAAMREQYKQSHSRGGRK